MEQFFMRVTAIMLFTLAIVSLSALAHTPSTSAAHGVRIMAAEQEARRIAGSTLGINAWRPFPATAECARAIHFTAAGIRAGVSVIRLSVIGERGGSRMSSFQTRP